MNVTVDFDAIKSQTLLALPEDNAYLFRLGVALYGFASLSSFLAEVTCHLDDTLDRTAVGNLMGSDLVKKFEKIFKKATAAIPEIEPIALAVASNFRALNAERADFVHSYSITNSEKEQILQRRLDVQGKHFEITNDFLDGFIRRLDEVSDELYKIRTLVKPDLFGTASA